MFARFRMNVQRYPRLFTAWLVGCVLAIAESLVPRLVGIDARHTEYALLADLALSLILAAVVYRLVFYNASRIAIFFEIADSIEGREVCTVAGHTTDEDDEYTEDEDEPIEEETEVEDEEEIL
jgi:hypothetical protein